MINPFSLYKVHLNILQLEGYQIRRYLNWVGRNLLTGQIPGKKGLVWTAKAKLILALSLFYWLLVSILLALFWGPVAAVLVFLVGLVQPVLFISLATLSLRPYEIWNWNRIRDGAGAKLTSLPHLKVIGITGSFGKTSIKEFLYQMLKEKYSVLKTPESYNTLLGIAKVIEWELDNSYDFFICEMGAYKVGEIAELARMTKPTYAILSGINEQHLERFGSIENTVTAKFELIEAIPSQGWAVINRDNDLIWRNYQKYHVKIISYGLSDNRYSLRDIKLSTHGSSFNLILGGRSYPARTKLVGSGNLSNILAAATMAHSLGMQPTDIVRTIGNLQPLQHRLEIKEGSANGPIIIDDSYSSNVAGFNEALETLRLFNNRTKVLATPGIVELGQRSREIHRKLGQKADEVCDQMILIGHSDRTEALKEGVKEQSKIHFISSTKDLWTEIKNNNLGNAVILLENDLPDNYL